MRRLLVALAIAGCAEGIPPESATGGSDNGSPAPPTSAPLGTFGVDYYYLPYQSDYDAPIQSTMTDSNCNSLAVVPVNFYLDVVDTGAGRLTDGRVLTLAGVCGCQQGMGFCFAVAQTPWGTGAQNRPLAPFRSIAVSGNAIAVGTRVYAPGLAGIRMPGDPPAGGFVHDGCLVVDDHGADRMKIDLFTGLRAYEQSLSSSLASDLQLYPAAGHCP
jgi:hypothetical protein